MVPSSMLGSSKPFTPPTTFLSHPLKWRPLQGQLRNMGSPEETGLLTTWVEAPVGRRCDLYWTRAIHTRQVSKTLEMEMCIQFQGVCTQSVKTPRVSQRDHLRIQMCPIFDKSAKVDTAKVFLCS